MGYEIQGCITPPIETTLLRTALQEKFSSLHWKIIRSDQNLLSVAFALRKSTEWNEDFVIGVGRTLEQAVNSPKVPAQEIAADKRQTILYVLLHIGTNPMWDNLVPLIDEVVNQFGCVAMWEEL